MGPLDVTPGIMPEAVDCVFSLTMFVLVGGVTVGPANVEYRRYRLVDLVFFQVWNDFDMLKYGNLIIILCPNWTCINCTQIHPHISDTSDFNVYTCTIIQVNSITLHVQYMQGHALITYKVKDHHIVLWTNCMNLIVVQRCSRSLDRMDIAIIIRVYYSICMGNVYTTVLR